MFFVLFVNVQWIIRCQSSHASKPCYISVSLLRSTSAALHSQLIELFYFVDPYFMFSTCTQFHQTYWTFLRFMVSIVMESFCFCFGLLVKFIIKFIAYNLPTLHHLLAFPPLQAKIESSHFGNYLDSKWTLLQIWGQLTFRSFYRHLRFEGLGQDFIPTVLCPPTRRHMRDLCKVDVEKVFQK